MPLGLTVPIAFSSSWGPTAQADLSRLTNTLKTLVEMNVQCWKGQDCDLSEGVRQGINVVSAHTQRHADLLELRVCLLSLPLLFGCRNDDSVAGGVAPFRPVCCCKIRWKA
jgi:hypothetical protein